jgi:AraC-like DNA-binding protein
MSTLAVANHTATLLGPLADEAVALIDRSYADPRLSPGTLAQRLFISRRQLYRALEEVDTSPALAIALRRTIAAAELLALHPDLPRSEIARRCGFSSATALRRHLDRHAQQNWR